MLKPDTLLNDRYRILRLLGRGGMGSVYLCQDEASTAGERRVAIKSLSFQQLDPVQQPRARAQFAHEGRMLAKLDHPNLVRALDAFEVEDEAYIVMSYVDGQDLATVMEQRGRPMELAEVLNISRQLLQALDYLHTQVPPIIFRDLKPRNIMLTPEGRVVLVDFGISRIIEDETQTQSYLRGLGSPGFAPLEQYTHAGTDQRSDLYSLGATMYFLLSNQNPASPLGLVAGDEVLVPLLQLNSQVPAWLNRLILRLLSLRREHRPISAQEVFGSLERAGDDSNLDSTAELYDSAVDPPTVEMKRGSGRSRGLLAVVLGVGLVGFGGGSYLASRGHKFQTLPTPARAASGKGKETLQQRLHRGEAVVLQAGNYKLGGRLQVQGRLRLRGQGPERTRLICDFGGGVLTANDVQQLELSGIDFVHQGSTFGYTVTLNSCQGKVRNCRFSGAVRDTQKARGGSGLRISGASRVRVEQCEAKGNQKNGIQVSENSQAEVVQNHCHHNGQGGIALIGQGRGELSGNRCLNNPFGILLLDASEAVVQADQCQQNEVGLGLFDDSSARAEGLQLQHNRKLAWGRSRSARLDILKSRVEGRSDADLPESMRPK